MGKLNFLWACFGFLVHCRPASETYRATEHYETVKHNYLSSLSKLQQLSSKEKTLALSLLSHSRSPQLSRRTAIASSFGLLAPSIAHAGDPPRPEYRLGVVGLGKNKDKSGRLNECTEKGCISSFDSPLMPDSYIPAWAYKGKTVGATMSLDNAFADLRAVVEAAGGNIVTAENRYLYAEFRAPITGAIDDVEFIFNKDSPLVGYRSQPRQGKDDKRQRTRIRDLRKALQEKNEDWGSVERVIDQF